MPIHVNQNNSQQQAYDRGTTIFSPDGRLYQVEYAREAVKRGSPSIGVRTENGVVLAAQVSPRSPLLERESIEKIHRVDTHIGMASAGHVADARRLVDVARQEAQLNQVRYNETVGVETLTKHLTDHIQEHTQLGGSRPYGVSLLVAGVMNDESRLFEADPSGTPYEWNATAIGGEHAVQEYLEANYSPDLALDDGIKLALNAMQVGNPDLGVEDITIATITTDSPTFTHMDNDDIETHLTAANTEEDN